MADDSRGTYRFAHEIGAWRNQWIARTVTVLVGLAVSVIVTRILVPDAPIIPVFVGTFLLCVGVAEMAVKHIDR